MAYNKLLNEGNNQAVLICGSDEHGKSGAGKTECLKFVLAYELQYACQNNSDFSIENAEMM